MASNDNDSISGDSQATDIVEDDVQRTISSSGAAVSTADGTLSDTLEHLVVYQDPPKCPIVGEYFQVHIWLLDYKEQLLRGKYVPLQLTLKRSVAGKELETVPFGENGVANLVVTPVARFKHQDKIVFLPSIDCSGQALLAVKVNIKPRSPDETFSIHVQALDLKSDAAEQFETRAKEGVGAAQQDDFSIPKEQGRIPEDCFLSSCSCTTASFRTYRYRLHNTKVLPDDWMRDPGGRRNCLELGVELHGPYNKIVKQELIPLRLQLEYENGKVVDKQDLLQVHSPVAQVLSIDWSGRMDVSCRIQEVSSRHLNKRFVIAVFPDSKLDPNVADIAPVRSNPVRVRSKVNKSRQRMRELRRVAKRQAIEKDRLQTLLAEADPKTSNKKAKTSGSQPPPGTDGPDKRVGTTSLPLGRNPSLFTQMASTIQMSDSPAQNGSNSTPSSYGTQGNPAMVSLTAQLNRTLMWNAKIDSFLSSLQKPDGRSTNSQVSAR